MHVALLGHVLKERLSRDSLENLLEQTAPGKVLLRQKMAVKHLLTSATSTVIVQFNKRLLIICFVFFKHLGVRQLFSSFI